MLWDVLLAIGIGVSQVILTWYGVHVSVQEHRIRNAFIIGLVGLIGVVLTVGGTIRNSINQGRLQAQIDKIQRNTEQPPIINVQPSPVILPNAKAHTRVDFLDPFPNTGVPSLLPFRKDAVPSVNVGFRNGGDFQVQEPRPDVKIILVDGSPGHIPENTCQKNRHLVKPYSQAPWGAMNPHPPDGHYLYHSYFGNPLSEDDVTRLNSGNKDLCAIGITAWKDETGRYETDFCQCFASELDGHFMWHMLSGNNVEHKLP
jgi:hypothetical protein